MKKKMRVNLIHNPVAGGKEQPDAEQLTELIRRAGHQVTYQSSDDADATQQPERACDLVAVAGGDGTLGRVAKRLVGRGVPLSFLPMGTANNISKTLGLSKLQLIEIIESWKQPHLQRIDVGVIDTPNSSRYFIEGVGIGLFVRTMIEIDSFNALGHLSTAEDKLDSALHILGERLKAFPAKKLHLTLDEKDLSGEYIMAEVMNIRYVGPNLYIAPKSDPADGLLDVVLITERERDELQEHLLKWRRGVLGAPALPTYRGSHLRIEGPGEVLHVDDEAWSAPDVRHQSVSAPIDLRAHKHALEVLLPSNLP